MQALNINFNIGMKFKQNQVNIFLIKVIKREEHVRDTFNKSLNQYLWFGYTLNKYSHLR